MASAACTRVVLLCCGSFNPITNMHLRMFEIARDYLHHQKGKYQVVAGLISPVNDAYVKKDLIDSHHRIEMCRLALQSSDWISVDSWECEQNHWNETAKVLAHHQSKAMSKFSQCKDVQARGVKRRRNNQQCASTEEAFQGKNLTVSRTSQRIQGQSKRSKFENDPTLPHSQVTVDKSNDTDIQVKLLCGADLLESFAVPGLWTDEDIEDIVQKHGLVIITRAGSDPQRFVYESDVLHRNSNNIHIVTEWMYNEISSTRIRRAVSRAESIQYIVPDPVIQYIKTNELYQKDKNNKNKSN